MRVTVSVYSYRFLFMIFLLFVLFFFFKQKTAYEMRISDWSSDVCSSDLIAEITRHRIHDRAVAAAVAERAQLRREIGRVLAGKQRKHRCHLLAVARVAGAAGSGLDRKSGVWGKSVAGRVDLGGPRIHKKKTRMKHDNAHKRRNMRHR